MLKTLVSQVKPKNFFVDKRYKSNGTVYLEFLCKNARVSAKVIRQTPLIGITASNMRTTVHYRINEFDDDK